MLEEEERHADEAGEADSGRRRDGWGRTGNDHAHVVRETINLVVDVVAAGGQELRAEESMVSGAFAGQGP